MTRTASLRVRPLGIRSSRPLALFLALPVLFLHERFQPSTTVRFAGASVGITLADVAVLCVAAVAAVAARRDGLDALRAGRAIWMTAAAFLIWIAAATFYPLAFEHGYPWKTHLVTGAKYAEYALLAPAVPLLLRRRDDVRRLIEVLAAVSVAATTIGLLQFCGLHILAAWPAGGRQPSFVGVDDFGALSAATFALALGIVALGARGPRDRSLAYVAGVAGGIGVVCSGSLAAVLGLLLATPVAALVGRRYGLLPARRAVVLALMAGALAVGGVVMRGSTLTNFAHFLGVGRSAGQSSQVESYSHRWLLDYIGLLMFRDHPVLGAGWARAYDQGGYGPYLAKARARYPGQPALAFPSPQHPWGIQNAYVEALAELGVVGFVLFIGMIASGLGVAGRRLLRGPPAPGTPAFVGLLWLLVAVGVWNSLWLIAGNPFDAIVWLAFGLAATELSRHGGDHDREASPEQERSGWGRLEAGQDTHGHVR